MQERHIGRELKALNNLILRYLENNGEKKKIDRMTCTNGWIIGYIADHEDEDVCQRDLEQEFSITRSTASKVVKLMVQKDLIELHSVEGDARLKKLVLTTKAKEIFAEMKRDSNEMENTLVKGFSEEELALLRSYLMRMKDNVKA